jgi:hypothetical protein
MPAYEYDTDHGAFAKACPTCDEVTIGTENEIESFKLFELEFSLNKYGADGLERVCRTCSSSRRRQLGVSKTILRQMFKKQNGKCDICKREISMDVGASRDTRACLDHDHDTGKVRGLLCGFCNSGIGYLCNDIKILRAAIEYLESKEPLGEP